jgi:FtsP/CotA-like multicopper oxidase with cupredoxin domain
VQFQVLSSGDSHHSSDYGSSDSSASGWKDTVRVTSRDDVSIVVRWAPQDTPAGAVQPGQNLFTFDPTSGPGYVWHCHILEHEDNEMMRPYFIGPNPPTT